MNEFNNIDCRTLSFSPELSSKRFSKAQLIFGEKVIKRIVCYCLYILGVRRIDISEMVNLPENTVRTMLKVISKDGFAAFFDRRKKEENGIEKRFDKSMKKKDLQITELEDHYQITINELDISISKKNKHQLKAMLLTFAENGSISKTDTGKLLNISSSHVGYLINNMSKNDLLCLIDKRQGQQQGYVFTPELKSELILQFASNAASGKSTSGSALANDLKERTQLDFSERSVRMYISKLGLKGMGKKLRLMLEKKTLGNS